MKGTYQAHKGIGVILLLFALLSPSDLASVAELLAHAVGVHDDSQARICDSCEDNRSMLFLCAKGY